MILTWQNVFLIEFNAIHKKSIKWKRGSNGYSTNVPRYIADIAELFDMEPDPYFEGVCLTNLLIVVDKTSENICKISEKINYIL